MTGTALVPRATIDEIVGYRALAIQKFETAFAAMDEAFMTAAKAAGGTHFHIDRDKAREAFSTGQRDRAAFLTYLRKQTDRTIWGHLINGFGFDKLMDRQAHEEFRDQLSKEPPEVTIDVAEATLLHLLGDADRIFKRGIANAFTGLDRRFRSHDGFKIGERVVLSYCFDQYGSWSSWKRHDDTLMDIERQFYLLDDDAPRDDKGDKILPERYAGIVGLASAEMRKGPSLACHAFVVEDQYFKLKAFKNGNAHLWFKRDDLLRKVNRLLGEYYGEVLGAGADAVEDDPLAQPTTAVAKNMGWFPTPQAVAQRMMGQASMNYSHSLGHTHFRVLEPSAGEGAIAMALREHMENSAASYDLDLVELNHGRAEKLQAMRFGLVIEADFLQMRPDPIYDRILMNPPFDRGLDVAHVAHAVKFLAPGGRIVAIMAAGVEYRSDRKTEAFRKLVEAMNGEFIDLPPGSFEESGTGVNTVMVVLKKKAA